MMELNKKELEEYLWIPVEELITNRTTVKFSFGKSQLSWWEA
jgi:hypothetical protein